MDKSLFYFKKTFFIFQNIIKQKGLFFLIGLHFYYFKLRKSTFFHIGKQEFIPCLIGFFSNFLYSENYKHVPDLILLFNLEQNIGFLKEFKRVGIPTISLIDSESPISLTEYPICLNTKSYFINMFFLITYSKIILVTKL